MPQRRSTFFGGHYYSFVTREYLLNLLLFYYRDHGLFPTGAICIVNQWVWDGLLHKYHGKWLPGWAWRFVTRRADLHDPGYWVHIPSLLSVLQEGMGGAGEHGLTVEGKNPSLGYHQSFAIAQPAVGR